MSNFCKRKRIEEESTKWNVCMKKYLTTMDKILTMIPLPLKVRMSFYGVLVRQFATVTMKRNMISPAYCPKFRSETRNTVNYSKGEMVTQKSPANMHIANPLSSVPPHSLEI